MNTTNGGTAFPSKRLRKGHENGVGLFAFEDGMTLRDYFAAKAMQSALIDWSTPSIDENFKIVAEFSYKMADAMLEARKS